MNTLRLPTMNQLERMGGNDADALLSYIQSELSTVIGKLPGTIHSRDRRLLQASIRRVKKRRLEFFGQDQG